MKKVSQYITLANDRKVRIVWDESIKKKLIDQHSAASLEDVKNGSIQFLADLFFLMASEGEKLDGKELGLTEKEFNRVTPLKILFEFGEISKKMITNFYEEKPFKKVYFRN
jgi:hypothetical protein